MLMEIKKYRWHTPLCLPIRCAPVCAVLRILLLFCMRALPVVQIYATAAFLDGAMGLTQGSGSLEGLAFPVAILALTILVEHCGAVVASLLRQGIGNGI